MDIREALRTLAQHCIDEGYDRFVWTLRNGPPDPGGVIDWRVEIGPADPTQSALLATP